MMYVKTEEQRIPTTISFIKGRIDELDREIKECDYEEDPDGNMVYVPNTYSYEKKMYENEKRKMEIILTLLTQEPPFSAMDW